MRSHPARCRRCDRLSLPELAARCAGRGWRRRPACGGPWLVQRVAAR